MEKGVPSLDPALLQCQYPCPKHMEGCSLGMPAFEKVHWAK